MDTTEILLIILQSILTCLLVYIGWQQWKTNEKSYKRLMAKYYIKNYSILSNAKALTIQNGIVTPEALALFWKARDHARLILSEEIKTETQDLLDRALEENQKKNTNFISELLVLELYKKYRKHIQLK